MVSLSTTEEKFHGVVHSGIEVVWIQHPMGEISFLFETLIVAYCDKLECDIGCTESYCTW